MTIETNRVPKTGPNYPISGRETPGQAIRRSGLLTRALPQDPDFSERTLRRRRHWRRTEIKALLERDGRVTRESAIARVKARKNQTEDRWVKTCDECGTVFEAKRKDARFHSDGCRKRAARRSR